MISGCGTGDDEPWFYESEDDCNVRCNWCEEGICESSLFITDIKPTKFSINSIYPNPFNPSTTIEVELPIAGIVNVDIYDLNGELVTNLSSDYYLAGQYNINWNADNTPSGIYFITVRSNKFTITKKLLLLK